MQKKEQQYKEHKNLDNTDEPTSTGSESQTIRKSESGSYERDFTNDEVLTSTAVAITFFVGSSTAVSYLILEVVDYLYISFSSGNAYLWIGALFALNSLAILFIRDVVLPYFMKKEYSFYTKFKQEYFNK